MHQDRGVRCCVTPHQHQLTPDSPPQAPNLWTTSPTPTINGIPTRDPPGLTLSRDSQDL